jgi:hypothetical protein
MPDVLPQAPWTVHAMLPDLSSIPYPANRYRIEAIRSIGEYAEIWLSNFDIRWFEPELVSYYRFLIYRTDTREWVSISAQSNYPGVYVNRLFVDQDGTLWGQNFYDGAQRRYRVAFLSYFNPATESFEIVWESQRIPADQTNATVPIRPIAFLDNKHTFWVFVNWDGIYSYHTRRMEVERQVDISDFELNDVARSPDGSFYITSHPSVPTALNKYSVQEAGIILYHYIPGHNKLERVAWPSARWPRFSNLLVDSSGRLWFDAVGWLSPNGQWHLLFPNPTAYFLRVAFDPASSRVYPSAYITLGSSDGCIWFEREATRISDWEGLAWYDPKTETGCWFTTERAILKEDTQGNVWMVIDGKLYTAPLEP